jgi:CO/xanthine dehydrogenase Mo-binding subunit
VSETRKLDAILVSDVVGYSRLAGADEDRILGAAAGATKRVSLIEAVRASGLDAIEAEETAAPGIAGMISEHEKSRNVHSAVFVEVRVDEDLDQVRVTRVVTAVASGRIINPKTARSQILGGVVMGISMALFRRVHSRHHAGQVDEPQLRRISRAVACGHREHRGDLCR